MNNKNYKRYFYLILIIAAGLVVRLYFLTGHVFSDDAYYSYLSYTFLHGEFAIDYLGYPVFPLRIAFIGLTSFSMSVLGVHEAASIFFPFVFSLLNILLTYKLTHLITKNDQIALIAALLVTFFPTDIIFASINFPDLLNVFIINLGIYFLLKSHFQKKIVWAYFGGISLFLSMHFKENTYYTFILFIVLIVFLFFKHQRFIPQLVIGLVFIAFNYIIEGFIYLLLHNDFFYRITITSLNYQYSFYDFFPSTAQKLSGSKNYLRNLFDQIFLINAKSVFLRRFYLFLPLVTAAQTYFSIRKKEHSLLLYWFLGTVILLIGLTTSFAEYKPLDLARSWYIYPVLMPMVILSAIFINRFSKFIRNGLLIVYTIGSLIMCFEYHKFFDKQNLEEFKFFLRENKNKVIYTDHFTRYSVDLILEYENNSHRILGSEFNLKGTAVGSWILFNKKHIYELEMQNYNFPDFSILKTNEFKKVASFNDFIFYEKLP